MKTLGQLRTILGFNRFFPLNCLETSSLQYSLSKKSDLIPSQNVSCINRQYLLATHTTIQIKFNGGEVRKKYR